MKNLEVLMTNIEYSDKYAIEKLVENCEKKNAWIKRLQDENKQIKSDIFKCEELAQLKAENEELKRRINRGFPISDRAQEKINSWVHAHEKKCVYGRGTIGGRYIYEFIPTSIGVVGTIKCSCREEFTFQELV